MKLTRRILPFFILHSAFFISASALCASTLTPAETSAINAAAPDEARAKPQKPRRLLVFYRTEGFVHKSIPNANYALERMGFATGAYTTVISDDMAQFDPAKLNTYDAVVFNNTSQLKFDNPAHRQALLDFVRNGKGMIGIHAGSDNFPTWPEGQALMGGVFHSHPWIAKDTVAVKNDDPGHILNTAFEKRGFWITEEIYQITGPYSRDTQRVLLSLDMSRPENARPANKIVRADNDFPISWLKTEGKGRVFYTSLGHNKNIFEVPQILQHILDGIQFALGDLEADAIPSAQLKTQPKPALAPDDKTTLQALSALPTLAALSTYEYGDPLAPQLAYEKHLRIATPDQRAAIETDLIALIDAPKTTLAAKRVFLSWLGWVGTEKSIPTLTAAARTPDLAHSAIRALAGLNAHPAGKALIPLTTDAYPEATRIEALNALGQRRSNPAVAAIAKLAGDPNPAISTAALEALANIGTFDAIEHLRSLPLSGPAQLVRTRALLAATGNLARRTAPNSETRDQAIHYYSNILAAVTDPTARIETAQALVSLDPTNRALFQFAANSDPRLRAAIACGMATSENPDAIKILTTRFTDIAPDTQRRMMRALAAQPSASGIPHSAIRNPHSALPLVDLALASPDDTVRLAAIAAAASCGNETTVAKLLPLLASENSDISTAAFTALTQLPDCDGKVNTALQKQLPDNPKLLLALAQRQDRTTFPTAIASTTSSDAPLRAAAFEAVALLVRPGDLPQILPLAANLKTSADRREWTKALYSSAASHPDTAEAVSILQNQLAAAKPADRASFIAALTMIKSDDAKAALNAMLTSPDPDARKEAIRALSSARTETAFDLLFERITAATDASERLLAQRGAIDTLDALAMPSGEKVAAYRKLWKTAGTPEAKDAIIAAVKRIRASAATNFLKEIAPEKPNNSKA